MSHNSRRCFIATFSSVVTFITHDIECAINHTKLSNKTDINLVTLVNFHSWRKILFQIFFYLTFFCNFPRTLLSQLLQTLTQQLVTPDNPPKTTYSITFTDKFSFALLLRLLLLSRLENDLSDF